MKKFYEEQNKIRLGLFDGSNTEGGDEENQGGEDSNTDGDQANTNNEAGNRTNDNDGKTKSMLKRFTDWLDSEGNSGENQDDSREANESNNDSNDNGGNDELEKRIAEIERRETVASLREAGVPKEMVDDAMALLSSSDEKDVEKFLSNRSYLLGESAKPKATPPSEQGVKKGKLSPREEHLQKMGYLK